MSTCFVNLFCIVSISLIFLFPDKDHTVVQYYNKGLHQQKKVFTYRKVNNIKRYWSSS